MMIVRNSTLPNPTKWQAKKESRKNPIIDLIGTAKSFHAHCVISVTMGESMKLINTVIRNL